jgi:glyoxylase-like metal-dependent hydrolase (beta-lactamase superfamily II)
MRWKSPFLACLWACFWACLWFGAGPAGAQQDLSQVEIKTTPVSDGVYMLEGAGGNIGVSVGEDGVFVIDDQFAPLSDKIMAAIRALTDKPVEFLLNTHHHGDHTGGNEPFGRAGAHIVAHDNARMRLGAAEGGGAPNALPVITFSHSATFHWNGHEIHIWHPETAHTDGDAIVIFRDLNVLHMGDVLFAGAFPYIDVDGGGSLNGYIAALEAVNSQIDAQTKIIPGHGPLATKAELEASLSMLQDVRARIQALIDDGLDEEGVAAADPLADLNEKWGQGFINGERMARAAFRSLTAE